MTISRTPLRHALLALSIALVATPVLAQDDPFEAIVANPDGANVRLNDVSIPARNPTEDELRQYLEAFRVVNLATSFTIDNRTSSEAARFGVPAGEAELGPMRVKNGTRVHLKAGFAKRPGEDAAVLRTLELKPENNIESVGFLGMRFHKMWLDEKSRIRVKLNLRAMGIDFWPTELTIEKIYRDRRGNLVFKTGGKGLTGAMAPDFRVTPDGQVQRQTLILRRWIDFKDGKGKKVTIDGSLPLETWPPKATDILDWLPEEGAEGATLEENIDAMTPVLRSIPITDMNVKFVADADPRRIELSNGEGHLNLSNHRLEYEANGSFNGRTYTSNPNKPNRYTATASVNGRVDRPGVGSATIDRLDVSLTGEHSGTIPFEDLEAINVEGSLNARVDGELSDVVVGLPGSPTVRALGRTTVDFDGTGRATLRPFTGDPDDKKEIVISRDSRYGFRTEGDVVVEGLGALMPEGTTAPDTLTLHPENGEPVLSGEGDMGTKMGFVFARPTFRLKGTVGNGGAIRVLNGEDSFATTLKPGAEVEVNGTAFAGIKMDTFEGGGVRLTSDARVRGTGANTTVSSNGVDAEFPGEADVEVRVASNVRHGTTNGNETIVRSVGVSGSATLREGEGTVDAGLPGQPRIRGTVAPGTNVEFNSGVMRRSDVNGTTLETEGYSRGERGATAKAHLVLTAGSIAHRDLALAFRGRTVVDLNAAVGFRMDPANPATGVQVRDAELALAIQFPQGATLNFKQGTQQGADVVLDGSTRIALSTVIAIQPDGSPELRSIKNVDVEVTANAIDLRTILAPLGSAIVHVGSRSTVKIKNANVEFLERGMRITHGGISIEIAPGVIEIGTR